MRFNEESLSEIEKDWLDEYKLEAFYKYYE